MAGLHCAAVPALSSSRRRFRKIRQRAAKRFFSVFSPVPGVPESVPDFLCVGPHRASGVGVFRMNKSSCLSLTVFQLSKGRSAPKRLGTPSVARDSSRAESNLWQALCDADGNSASSYREWPCLKAQVGLLNERNSDAANVCSISSRNLSRCRNRTLGRSKIPDISRSLWLAYHGIASQTRRAAPRTQSSRSEYARDLIYSRGRSPRMRRTK